MLNGSCGNVASKRGLHQSAQKQAILLSTNIKARQGDSSYMKVKLKKNEHLWDRRFPFLNAAIICWTFFIAKDNAAQLKIALKSKGRRK